ncbi:MAG: hypothetical protein AAF384_06715 [Pseudomonadota bacterium]
MRKAAALSAGAVLVIAGGWFWLSTDKQPGTQAEIEPRRAEIEPQETRPFRGPSGTISQSTIPPPDASLPPALSIATGKTSNIEHRALPRSAPLIIELDLGVPNQIGPRPTRILATSDGRVLELNGTVGESKPQANKLAIDTEWLKPDRYVIEVQTTEMVHIPLRRYILNVK